MAANPREYSRRWREKNREKIRAYNKEYWRKSRSVYENARLRYEYGIDLKKYEELLSEQDGGCAICGVKASGGKGKFHVDHDHATGVVRGLLCFLCNTMLGKARDSSATLRKAADYLEKVR